MAPDQCMVESQCISAVTGPVAGSSSSPSGGLACAIAALAERQQMGGETSSSHGLNMSTYNMLPGSNRFPCTEEREPEDLHHTGGSAEALPDDIQLAMTQGEREWVDNRSEMADIGTSYAGSDGGEADVATPSSFPLQNESNEVFHPIAGQIVPESFEEQMMLAMAVSLAEARARTSSPGVTWH